MTADCCFRSGVGSDFHRLAAGVPMQMAGLSFPDCPVGAVGHSDGDAAIHALCDALLSAAGLGDIGSNFGTSDPQYAGAASTVFLTEVRDLLAEAGYRVANACVQVIGRYPKLSPRRQEAQNLLSGFLSAPVSVTATTTDGLLGELGEGNGVGAIATALIYRVD